MKQAKKERLAEFNRTEILAAAAELFETRGLAQTTVDDIAERAACSKSTLYVYFKSKDEIYNTIVLQSMVMLREIMKRAAEAGKPFRETYFAVCGALADFQSRYPLYFSSILGEIGVEEQNFQEQPVLREIYSVGEEINGILAAVLAAGMEAGQVRRDVDPTAAIFLLWASLGGVIQMAQRKERYFTEKLHLSKQAFLDGSFRLLLRSLEGSAYDSEPLKTR